MNIQCKEVTGRKCNQVSDGKCVYCGGVVRAPRSRVSAKRVDLCPIALWWDNETKQWLARSADWCPGQSVANFNSMEDIRRSPEAMAEKVLSLAGAQCRIVFGKPSDAPVREAFERYHAYRNCVQEARLEQRVTAVL